MEKEKKSRFVLRAGLMLGMLLALTIIVTLMAPGREGVVLADGENVTSTDVTATRNEKEKTYLISTELSNQGKDFSGYFRIFPTADRLDMVEREVSIPEKNSKSVEIEIPMYVVSDKTRDVEVQVLDRSGNVIYTRKVKNLFVESEHYIRVSILSNRYTDLSYLDAQGENVFFMTGYFLVSLNEAKAGNIEDALAKSKFLVIDSYDISALSDDELTAIIEWTKKGGFLICGTGTNEDKAYQAFSRIDPAFIDVSNGTLTKMDDMYMIPVGSENWYDMVYAPDYYWMNDCAAAKSYGSGAVELLTVSLSDKLEYNQEQTEFVRQLYNDAVEASNYVVSRTDFDLQPYEIMERMGYMELPSNFNLTGVYIALIGYLVCISPLLYLILRKKDKKEWVWFIVPALSLLFVGVIFMISLGMKGFREGYRSLVVENTDHEFRDDFCVYGYHADASPWEEKVTDGVSAIATISDSYYWGNARAYTSGARYMSSGCTMAVDPDSIFDAKILVGKIRNDAEKKHATGAFELDISSDAAMKKVSGTVTNYTGYDFDFILVYDRGVGAYYRDVKNGAQITLDKPIQVVDMEYNPKYFMEVARQARRNDEFEDAATLFALDLGMEIIYDSSSTFVIGITKGNENMITSSNQEESWKCVYTVIR